MLYRWSEISPCKDYRQSSLQESTTWWWKRAISSFDEEILHEARVYFPLTTVQDREMFGIDCFTTSLVPTTSHSHRGNFHTIDKQLFPGISRRSTLCVRVSFLDATIFSSAFIFDGKEVSNETRKQVFEKQKKKQGVLIGLANRASNVVGFFHEFVDNKEM